MSIGGDVLTSLLMSGGISNISANSTSTMMDSLTSSTHNATNQKSFIKIISDVEQASLSLCEKIETLNLIVDQMKTEQITPSNEPIRVKLTSIDETLDKSIKDYIEQKLFSLMLNAITKGFNGTDSDENVSLVSAIKSLGDKTLDINVKNSGFDDVLNQLMYRTNM